ncbi:LLM class flavin-dependent oxidoreductase [Nocardia suismassiliense]|uniref:LLM class flavin-dependent oxidoreductase n=1 Tax=Nocardia suismassiliense TaxID=2077092 RepID=UPI000D1E1D3A|nr:LLM class flavin-dependent oxidoreductase [Nocardia suismassiliense]
MTAESALLFCTPEWNGMHPGAWRYPGAPADGAMDLDVVTALVRRAEDAGFQALFLADALGFRLEISHAALAHTGAGARFEPFTLASALATSTDRIGLIVTANTTYDEPYPLARRLASLDHLSGGRAGWNVVTGGFASGAAHFGRTEHVDHATRYARGVEFVDAVRGLWDSWEDDAFVRDQAEGLYFDPAKLHVLRMRGEHLSVTGPLNIPRPRQGHPVIAQAGSSGTGRAFAARFAEVIFTLQPTLAAAQQFYAEAKQAAAEAGRDPEHVKIMPSLTVLLAETAELAQRKAERMNDLTHPRVGLELLSAFLETDLTGYRLTDPLPAVHHDAKGTKTIQRFFTETAERERLSIGRLIPSALNFGAFVGTPAQVTDHIEQWISADAADGFNVTFTDHPESFDLFLDRVIPELRRRGLFRPAASGRTLRENLGLPAPPNVHAR